MGVWGMGVWVYVCGYMGRYVVCGCECVVGLSLCVCGVCVDACVGGCGVAGCKQTAASSCAASAAFNTLSHSRADTGSDVGVYGCVTIWVCGYDEFVGAWVYGCMGV